VIGTDLVARAHRRGLDVLVWTHRAENQHLPGDLRVGDADHGHGLAQRAAEQLFDAGVDAVITDFPETVVAARDSTASAQPSRNGDGNGTPLAASTSRARSG
jgi:glycerophosphoryl diester phosphodiesterase